MARARRVTAEPSTETLSFRITKSEMQMLDEVSERMGYTRVQGARAALEMWLEGSEGQMALSDAEFEKVVKAVSSPAPTVAKEPLSSSEKLIAPPAKPFDKNCSKVQYHFSFRVCRFCGGSQ
jgi:hypothetical protein